MPRLRAGVGSYGGLGNGVMAIGGGSEQSGAGCPAYGPGGSYGGLGNGVMAIGGGSEPGQDAPPTGRFLWFRERCDGQVQDAPPTGRCRFLRWFRSSAYDRSSP